MGCRGGLHGSAHDVHRPIGVGIARVDGHQDSPAAHGIEVPLRLVRGDAGVLQHLPQATPRGAAVRAREVGSEGAGGEYGADAGHGDHSWPPGAARFERGPLLVGDEADTVTLKAVVE
jgi:hypothetical protein